MTCGCMGGAHECQRRGRHSPRERHSLGLQDRLANTSGVRRLISHALPLVPERAWSGFLAERGGGWCRLFREIERTCPPPPGTHFIKVHARPFVGVSQKSIFKRPCQFLAINALKMAQKMTQWLQERPWNAPTKGLLWLSPDLPACVLLLIYSRYRS